MHFKRMFRFLKGISKVCLSHSHVYNRIIDEKKFADFETFVCFLSFCQNSVSIVKSEILTCVIESKKHWFQIFLSFRKLVLF